MNDTAFTWWNSLRHGGLLIAPARLPEYFPEAPPPLTTRELEALRRMLTRLDSGSADEAELLDVVLGQIAGLDGAGSWLKGSQLSADWSRRAVTGEAIRPRRVWQGPYGSSLPVFVDTNVSRICIGRGRRSISRVVEWLRASNERLALVTNLHEWRLVYAGIDFDAWCEWDTVLWLEEGTAGPQVAALRAMLTPRAFVPADEGKIAPLLAAIEASRKGQAELSAALGERVRLAVELLIQEHGEPLAQLADENTVTHRDIYIAATRVVMRLVVLLFAEARELLPRDLPVYHNGYGLHGLREQLEHAGGSTGDARLRHRYSAWPRVIALCRLVHGGSHHPELPVPRYGGDLFAPGKPDSNDPVQRALAVFEEPEVAPADAVVYRILHLLCRSRMRLRQGRAATWVEAPMDFSDLSSEYIGILYEGLLDFELRRATEDDPMVFLAIGDEPALPLSRLEAMDDGTLKDLLDKLKVSKDKDESGEETPEEEEPEETLDSGEEGVSDTAEGTDDAEPTVEPVELDDERQAARERALAWARRAVAAGGVVRRLHARSQQARDEYERKVEKAAASLIRRTMLPGEWFLVRWGGTRKGAGTFYTRPQLAVPTVQRTMRQLAYNAPVKNGVPDEDAPPTEWTPRPPELILALKVCDPAMGSGSFLVAALRFLADALYRSLHHYGRIQAQGERALVTLAEGQPSEGSLAEELLPCPVDADDFEPRLRARLMRYVVERCVYGVDIDPLAVELARLALWIETMDRELPFEFLDHKLKAGNSLVGCWFDRFRDYPALAWEREGGDKNHANGVHYKKDAWTKAIKQVRKQVQAELPVWIAGQHKLLEEIEGHTPESIHDEALAALEGMHVIPVHEADERARYYREHIGNSTAVAALKAAFDTWCAAWFWPADRLDDAPLPSNFEQLTEFAIDEVARLASDYRFFHWEIEFPDVFSGKGLGFDALLGNPPWEIQKPNSKEYFSNIDPLYRTYGKQEALGVQKALFTQDSEQERDWLAYNARFKALSNWCKNSGLPFGDGELGGTKLSLGRGRAGSEVHARWAAMRINRRGYADPAHPYLHQGSADLNTYKLFLEMSHALLRDGGQLGMLVPSGIYTDKGTTALRALFLTRCDWRWLFGFENRQGIFDIHRSFKFGPVIVRKGGETEAIRTAFMHHDLGDWEQAERFAIPYSRAQVERFSPRTHAILEIRHPRDLEVLEKIYANSVLLGDEGPDGWGIKYATEFHMTNDSKLFPPRPKWEAKGYKPDAYGRWIGPEGEVALPLYEGRMIGQFDFSQKGWVSGTGRSAVWQQFAWDEKRIESHYLMDEVVRNKSLLEKHLRNIKKYDSKLAADQEEERLKNPHKFKSWINSTGHKLALMDVTSSTNTRTVICSFIPNYPCNHKVPVLRFLDNSYITVIAFSALANSFVFDYLVRCRLGGNSLIWAVLEESPVTSEIFRQKSRIASVAAALAVPDPVFAQQWLELAHHSASLRKKPWRKNWSFTKHERLRMRCQLDAMIAALFDLEEVMVKWILADCDMVQPDASANDPKGFWRVDKNKDPELRHTVLTLAAFRDLHGMITAQGGDRVRGIEAFCTQNEGEGWMLPETLCLADLGLGHDDRAKEPQPVRERLGPRFYDWQLEQTPEESWAECEMHARNILGEEGFELFMQELEGVANEDRLSIVEPAENYRTGPAQGDLF